MKQRALWFAAIAVVAVLPAKAADVAPSIAVNPLIARDATTIALEVSPEFYARSNATQTAGNYADTQAKFKITHSFDNNWFVSGFFQTKFKGSDTRQYFGEGAVGYRFDISAFALKPSVAIGDTSGSTGLGKDKNSNAPYYALYLAGDLRLNSQWTWNMFDLRYRNAFDYTWITPKVTTGLTYEWRPGSFVYGNAGYAWKDTDTGSPSDKMSVALGLRQSF